MNLTASNSTSSSLLRHVQANDPEAWARFTQLYAPLAYGWCKQAGLQTADVADIVQNVFVAVYRNIANFRRTAEKAPFRSWLWTITRNEVRMHLRRAAGRPQAAGGTDAHQRLEQLPALFAAEAFPADSAAEHHLVRRALAMLQPEFQPATWQAFWRTTVDDQSAADVGRELGLNPGAVRQAKYRVLLRLRQFLADE